MSSRPARLAAAALACALVGASTPPAGADHTDPGAPLNTMVDLGGLTALSAGAGTWKHIKNFSAPQGTGTDLEFFHRDGAMYASGGQLGQMQDVSVGQRMLKLVDADGTVDPEWVADHGSASCPDGSNISSTTGLQHDTQTTPRATNLLDGSVKPNAELVIDNVDALGRCHDDLGGGMEFIDVSGLGTDPEFEPREVHLTRHNGYSHTLTVDATRPWIVYNSTSDFGSEPDEENPLGIGKAWIDILDIRTCLGLTGQTLEQKRAACRPKVYRLPFQYEWSAQEKESGGMRQPSACHDITARPGRIYCAALNGTIAFDVSGLTVAQGPDVPGPEESIGDIKGTPLPCEVVEADPAQNTAPTGAMVTDCALGDPNDAVKSITAWIEEGKPSAAGWKYLGHVNHPGRECNAPNGAMTCNSNLKTPSDEGVAVAHESDPSPGGRYLFVTDERGGGIVPPGATCLRTVDNPYGNGGMHVFDMTKKDEKGRFTYAPAKGGGKAVFITKEKTISPTFCTIHVIEQIPNEQRIVAAWYTQGVKIIDYTIDPDTGEWEFTEVASYVLQPNDIWAAEVFKIEDDAEGNRTYYFLSNDVKRGLDVFSWTTDVKGPPLQNEGAVKTPTRTDTDTDTDEDTDTGAGGGGDDDDLAATGADLTMLALALLLLPAAVVIRRRLART